MVASAATGFLGATTSGVAHRGAAPASDWAAWEQAGNAPRSNNGEGSDSSALTDLALLCDHGIADIRFTIDWARIEPEMGRPDEAEIERLIVLFRDAHDRGLRIWATLHDRSLPGWFAVDERGFRDARARSTHWPRHLDRCGEAFGDLLHAWVPTIAPVTYAAGAELAGWAPPGGKDLARFRETVTGLVAAQLTAWEVLRGDAPVVGAFDIADVQPTDRADPEAMRTAATVDQTWWAWTGAFRDGEYAMPDLPSTSLAGFEDAFDIIGINFVGSLVVDADGGTTGHRLEDGLARALDRVVADGPERPIALLGHRLVTGDDREDEDAAGRFIETMAEARRGGAPIDGWFHDTGIDGYDWISGFERPTGLFDKDRAARAILPTLLAASTNET